MDDVGQLALMLFLVFVAAVLFYWILVRGYRF
jgi:hypothetical protein